MAKKIIGILVILVGLSGSIFTVLIAQNVYENSYAEHLLHEVAQDDATAVGLILILVSFFVIVIGVGIVANKKTVNF